MHLLATLLAASALAQNIPTTGSISGVVRDVGTGTPMTDLEVSANRGSSKAVDATTDSQGHYEFRGLEAGSYRISVYSKQSFGLSAVRRVTLNAGQELTSIDLNLRTFGQISGKVLDENQEPVPGVWVLLVAREYSLGILRHVFASIATTNDRGEYRIERAEPGRAYLLDAISNVPANPKLRKRVFVPTYYPDSTSLDGAQALVLRVGEHREGIDIRLLRAPSYCIEGVLENDRGPAALQFEIVAQRPTSGILGNGGVYIASPGGESAPDGKIRLCDLPPGDYRITALRPGIGNKAAPTFFGTSQVTIADEDVRKVRLSARAQLPVPGEVVWDNTPPDQPVTSKLSILLMPMSRAFYMGESTEVKSAIPGEFSFPGLLIDEYAINLSGTPSGLYVKDITYAGASVLREPLRVGSAIGNAALRIVLARDGCTLKATVADKDGHPVPDSHVLILPASATTEASLAAAFLSGRTDQNGAYTSTALAPGKYYVLATTAPVDRSPESINKLWQARLRAKEVDLAPGTSFPLTLVPRTLD
jgi:hypothetical protein